MADLTHLFAKAQVAQAKLAEVQHKVAARRVEGTAGGGMVRAEVSGALRVLAISIEPALFASGDREMLQDLTAAAVNAAIASARRLLYLFLHQALSALGLPLAGSAKPA